MIKKITKFILFVSIIFSLTVCDKSSTGPSRVIACEGSPFSISINGPSAVTSGNNFEINISVNNVTGLVSAPFYLMYDPGHVSFVSATGGNFLKQDGANVTFLVSNDSDLGQVIVGNSRLGDRVGISGSGVVMNATFKAEVPGQVTFDIENARLVDGSGTPYVSQICSTSVEII